MTDAELTAIKERYEKATKGEWERAGSGVEIHAGVHHVGRTWYRDGESRQGLDDADFIAHAHADVPRLVAEVEQLSETIWNKNIKIVKLQQRLVAAERVIESLWHIVHEDHVSASAKVHRVLCEVRKHRKNALAGNGTG